MKFSERSRIILGEEGLERLAASTVAIFGLGGVGAACALDLVRAGVGRIIAFDSDIVSESNFNRLAFGFSRFLGRRKAEVFAELALEINPDCRVEPRTLFLSGAGAESSIPEDADLVIDAIDSLNPKVQLLAALARRKMDCLSSMGMAGRMEAERVRVGNLWATKGCPLAREVRNRLRRLGVDRKIMVVWTDEEPVSPIEEAPSSEDALSSSVPERPPGRKRKIQGSLPFVPQVAGHILASLAVRRLLSADSAKT